MEKVSVLQIVPHRGHGGVESVASSILDMEQSDYNIYYAYYIKGAEDELIDNKVYIGGIWSLVKFVFANKIKIIHSHSPFLYWMFIVRVVSLFFNVKVVTSVHSDFGLSNEIPLYKKGRRFFILKVINSIYYKIVCDHWVAVSEPVKRFLIDRVGVDDRIVSVVNNYVLRTDIDVNLSRSRDSIVFIGRDSPEKNVITLVNSFNEIKTGYPGVRLVLIGIEENSKSLVHCDMRQIQAVGWLSQDEIDNYMGHAIFQVIPSFYEGFPLACLQGLEKNIPLIAFPIPIFNFLSMTLSGIFLTEDFSSMSLTNTMRCVLERTLNGYKIDAKCTIANSFSKREFLSGYCKVYNYLLNN